MSRAAARYAACVQATRFRTTAEWPLRTAEFRKAATYGVSQLFGANAVVRCVLERRAARTITFILPDDESGAPSRPTVVLPREHAARRTFFRWQTNFLFSSR